MSEELNEARQMLFEKMAEVPRTIVYIDSNNNELKRFKEYFAHHFNVKTFKDPNEAFYWIKHNTVDLIVSEVNLPSLSGISLLRKIKLYPSISDIPFILVSENTIIHIPDAKKANANDLYQKPLNFDKLALRIKYLSKIRVNNNPFFHLLQKSWSKKIYPGVLKRITAFLFALSSLILFLPFLLIIALIIRIQGLMPLTKVEKIGAGYDLLKLINFQIPKTKFGKFIHDYNIYRWPELWNVIIGDLSLVGNKALSLDEAAKYTSDHNSVRFLSPSGLTGPRQLYDVKLDKSFENARELENDYAMHRTAIKDLRIFFKSILFLFKNANTLYTN